MKISQAKVGDIVKCDYGGHVFYALVTGKHRTGNQNTSLDIEPLQPNVSYRHVVARQVIGHWRRVRS